MPNAAGRLVFAGACCDGAAVVLLCSGCEKGEELPEKENPCYAKEAPVPQFVKN